RLAAIVESSNDAIVGTTLDGVITSWNRAAERMFGYGAAEAIGQSIMPIVPGERAGEERAALERMGQGLGVEPLETARRRRDGALVSVLLTVSPVRDRRGRIAGVVQIARDVAESSRLDETQARLASIVNSSDDAIVSKTLEGVITSWNRSAE